MSEEESLKTFSKKLRKELCERKNFVKEKISKKKIQ